MIDHIVMFLNAITCWFVVALLPAEFFSLYRVSVRIIENIVIDFALTLNFLVKSSVNNALFTLFQLALPTQGKHLQNFVPKFSLGLSIDYLHNPVNFK